MSQLHYTIPPRGTQPTDCDTNDADSGYTHDITLLSKAARPDLLLKGSRYLVYPHDSREGWEQGSGTRPLSHLIRWHHSPTPEYGAFSFCEAHAYRFVEFSPRGTAPRFIEARSQRLYVGNTVLRRTVPLSALCPRCLQGLQELEARGLLVPYTMDNVHPETRKGRAS